jgi:hypothetical protein
MSATDSDTTSEIITLDPLRSDGPHALDTHDSPEIQDACLHELEILTDDAFHQATIKRADDLFQAASLTPEPPVPQAGTLHRAIFILHLKNSDKPHTVELVPPHTIRLPPLLDPAVIVDWLGKRRYRILATISHNAAVLLLALASAVAPALGDGDNDDDDCDSDRIHVFAPA